MAPRDPSPAEDDELDALFNDYTDAFSTDLPPPPTAQPPSPRRSTNLGLDAPLTLPTRAPRAKLDEARLLSARGIPKLRQRAGALRLKGKGHEYGDAERLLSLYQLWLDDLYPKARFADALVMVEKVGHKKNMVAARRGWIEEGRPRGERDEVAAGGGGQQAEGQGEAPQAARIAPIFTDTAERAKTAERLRTPAREQDVPDDLEDLYDATPRRNVAVKGGDAQGQGQTSIFGPGAAFPPTGVTKQGGEPDEEDDLDALLAEAEMNVDAPTANTAKPAPVAAKPNGDDEFDDEMEAMAEMGW